jgi:hypothetical protein
MQSQALRLQNSAEDWSLPTCDIKGGMAQPKSLQTVRLSSMQLRRSGKADRNRAQANLRLKLGSFRRRFSKPFPPSQGIGGRAVLLR